MNVKISVFVICIEVIIYLLLYNLHDCAFNIHGNFVPHKTVIINDICSSLFKSKIKSLINAKNETFRRHNFVVIEIICVRKRLKFLQERVLDSTQTYKQKFYCKMTNKLINTQKSYKAYHCVKSVRIWSFPGPYLPAFGLNRERYEVSFCIQSKCGKIRTRKTPKTDTFHALYWSLLKSFLNNKKFLLSLRCSMKIVL